MKLEDLTPELQERLKKCETPEELMGLVKEEGIELTEEQLEDIAGGRGFFKRVLLGDFSDLGVGDTEAIRKF